VHTHEAISQPHMVRGDNVKRTICAGVINYNDEIDEVWHSVKHRANEFLLIVRWHDDRDSFPLVHVWLLTLSGLDASL